MKFFVKIVVLKSYISLVYDNVLLNLLIIHLTLSTNFIAYIYIYIPVELEDKFLLL